jgi:hypothetical protein
VCAVRFGVSSRKRSVMQLPSYCVPEVPGKPQKRFETKATKPGSYPLFEGVTACHGAGRLEFPDLHARRVQRQGREYVVDRWKPGTTASTGSGALNSSQPIPRRAV